MRFLIFPKIEILSPNPSEMMTLRVQILNFLCFAGFLSLSGHGAKHSFPFLTLTLSGAKHSFPFLTLTLSWGRGNIAREAFDVLLCK